jgi:hypothetical protein
MKSLTFSLRVAALSVALIGFAGCESTDSGGGSVSGGMYYGVGFADPWYYGGYYDDVDIIVTPPGDRPDTRPPQPSHPIARPTPAPRPTPSIPSAPRPSFRR